MTGPATITVTAVRWPEVRPGDDLAAHVLASTELLDGDVLVLTSKVVSKSEGRGAGVERTSLVAAETRRVVARRGSLVVAETRHGLVMAAAGVDSSNTVPGTALALPLDPDDSARQLRTELNERAGRNVAVLVSDTAGRAWRIGQTDLAIGCAGLDPVASLQGTRDDHGNELLVTAPAVADEAAAAGDLVKGKTSRCPLAVVRGLASLVLPAGQHGPGAAAVVRPAADNLFALGSRDAAVAAARRDDPAALAAFPTLGAVDADPFSGLTGWPDVEVAVERSADEAGRRTWTIGLALPTRATPAEWFVAGRLAERVRVLAAAHRLTAGDPLAEPQPTAGWTVVDSTHWVTS